MEQNKIQEMVKTLSERSKNRHTAAADGKKRGHLVVLDGKPPVADNTTLMLHLVAFSAIDDDRPTAFFSLGKTNDELAECLISIIAGIDHDRVASRDLSDDDWKKVDEMLPKLMKAPLYLDDTLEMTLDELRQKLTRLAEEKGVTLTVIDNVKKITSTEKDTDIDAAIKQTAEQLGMTVIVVAE